MNQLPDRTLSWLKSRGFDAAVADGCIKDDAAVTRCFRESFPAEGIWCDESRAWLCAQTDCLSSMNEMLYHLYRPMCDLFRRFVALYASSVPQDDPLWKESLALGDRLGLVDRDDFCRVPHKN